MTLVFNDTKGGKEDRIQRDAEIVSMLWANGERSLAARIARTVELQLNGARTEFHPEIRERLLVQMAAVH